MSDIVYSRYTPYTLVHDKLARFHTADGAYYFLEQHAAMIRRQVVNVEAEAAEAAGEVEAARCFLAAYSDSAEVLAERSESARAGTEGWRSAMMERGDAVQNAAAARAELLRAPGRAEAMMEAWCAMRADLALAEALMDLVRPLRADPSAPAWEGAAASEREEALWDLVTEGVAALASERKVPPELLQRMFRHPDFNGKISPALDEARAALDGEGPFLCPLAPLGWARRGGVEAGLRALAESPPPAPPFQPWTSVPVFVKASETALMAPPGAG